MFSTLQQQDELVFGTTSRSNNNNNTPPQNIFIVEDLTNADHPGDFQVVFGTTSNNNTSFISPPEEIFIVESDPITTDRHGNFQLISNNNNTLSFSNNNAINFSDKTTSTATIKQQTKFSSGKREAADDDMRKVMHREYERQRRQQMSIHLASLRSLLPHERVKIKGNRSLSDHMQEAANHIKKLKKNVEELRIRRDKLRNLLAINPESSTIVRESSTTPNCVTVNSESNGNWIEILISCSTENSEFRLSGVIEELTGQKIDVVSCVCTRKTKTGEFLCTIQAAADDRSLVDLSALQKRLRDVIDQQAMVM